MQLGPDLFPDAPRGNLDVHITISGVGRTSSPNGIEFTNFNIQRSADMHLLMVLADEGRGPMVPIRGHDLTNPEMPEFQQTIANAIEACKGDLACQVEAATRYSQALEADPQGFGTTELDEQRYQNWISDQSGPCATGSLSINDNAKGMAIDPPYPAKSFAFAQIGTQNLAGAPDDVLGRVCDVWLSYDSKEAVVSIRLPVYGFWLEAEYRGDITGSHRLQLIEEGPSHAFSLDQPAEWNDGALSGRFKVNDIGKGYINGPMNTPVSATITWSFSPELQ